MSESICRWGILGTATIARKNWQSIRRAENSTLAAVASRDLERSKRFIAECQSHVPFDPPPVALGGYEELLARDDIDAVYIPLPTSLRKQWVIAAAEAGKHVLAEKPCGVNAAEVTEMIEACRRNNVQYMDGVMFMHSGRLNRLRQVIDDGESVGRIKRIATQFSFLAPDEFLKENIRTSSELEPLGCLGDLGWYNIRFILWTLNWQTHERVVGRMLSELRREDSPAAVPMEFSGELFFGGGISASFYCSFLTQHQQWVNVSGDKGYVYLPDFVLPYYGNEVAFDVAQAVFHFDGCNFNMENYTRREAVAEYSSSAPNAQETNMIRNFAALALSGKPDPSWGKIALQTQQVMDACLESARAGGETVEMIG